VLSVAAVRHKRSLIGCALLVVAVMTVGVAAVFVCSDHYAKPVASGSVHVSVPPPVSTLSTVCEATIFACPGSRTPVRPLPAGTMASLLAGIATLGVLSRRRAVRSSGTAARVEHHLSVLRI
jgi:hypothetical protein